MKILCICQRGNVRSVAMAALLKDYHSQDAVSVGWQTAGAELYALLLKWADRVILMEEHMRQYVPPEYQGKVLVCDVGPDVYGSSQHPTLRLKINDWLRQCLVYLNASKEVKKG